MVSLRDLHSIDDFRRVVELEHEIWGYTDYADVVTVPVFIITVKRGGILIGAFDETDRMVGFVFSLVGVKDGTPIAVVAHDGRVAGVPAATGLGRELKLAQRERAVAAGFDLMEWTFDPLQAANAHLNFAKLGVVADEYAINLYGESTSALHRGTPTDRLRRAVAAARTARGAADRAYGRSRGARGRSGAGAGRQSEYRIRRMASDRLGRPHAGRSTGLGRNPDWLHRYAAAEAGSRAGVAAEAPGCVSRLLRPRSSRRGLRASARAGRRAIPASPAAMTAAGRPARAGGCGTRSDLRRCCS